MIKKINSVLYTITVQFEMLDVAIDVARLLREPTPVQMEKIASDAAYLYSLCSGVNVYSIMAGGMEAAYQMCLGKYSAGFEVVVGMVNAMALSYILLSANRPYLGFAYGVLVALNTEHNTVSNAHTFLQEIASSDAHLRSKIAYKTLSEKFASSSLQALHDFKIDIKEYELQINDILFEKEKLAIKAQAQEQGKFGQDVFDYIYLPELTKKYSLLNGVMRGMPTEEKIEVMKFKHLTIAQGPWYYDHCVEAEDVFTSEKDVEHYYCYNSERQVIEHIAIDVGNNLEVLERLSRGYEL